MPGKGIYDHDKSYLDAVLAPLGTSDKKLFSALRLDQSSGNKHRKSRYKSFDCSIMEIADDIAYGIHDLEDAIAIGIVSKALWQEKVATQLAEITELTLVDELTGLTNNLFFRQHFQREYGIGECLENEGHITPTE